MHELNQTLLISINDRNVWLKINEDHTRTIVEGSPYKDDTGSHHVNDDHANLVVDEVESDVGEFEPNSPPAVIAMAEDASKFDIPGGDGYQIPNVNLLCSPMDLHSQYGGSTTNQSPRHAKPAKGGANVPGPISDVGPTQVENNEQSKNKHNICSYDPLEKVNPTDNLGKDYHSEPLVKNSIDH
ncbi:hypothetical protein Tco_0623005 [Tanacetum coccineum]